MKTVIQRVKKASVEVGAERVGVIDQGALLFLGIQKTDSQNTADKLLEKILAYRIFADEQQKMNLSLRDIGGGLLIVSQFTLAADTQKGLRPSFSSAASPAQALELYSYFVARAKEIHATFATGIFGADMQVSLINDGPVTFMLTAE